MTADVHAARSSSQRTRRIGLLAALATAGLLALAGCGSSSSSSSTSSTPTTTSTPAATSSTSSTSTTPKGAGAGAQSIALAANTEGQLAYNTTTLSAKAGKVTIAFTNAAPIMHNVTVESASGEKLGQTETFSGGTKNLALTLKAGTYKFYCSVPGHRQAGMEGTLTVQ